MIGRCPVCGEWGTYTEDVDVSVTASSPRSVRTSGGRAQRLSEVSVAEQPRLDMHNAELNRVLGGGLVPGSLTLLGGDPGIGKSTLALQVAMGLTQHKVLYVSGEESLAQLKLRAQRLGNQGDMLVAAETNLERILDMARNEQPDIVVVDSIQTISSDATDTVVGSVSQVRECAVRIMDFAKSQNVAFLIIGHITKEGSLAGPKVLEHIVDTVLQFEGDPHYMYRILRAQKNRFGSTSEIGIYQMERQGLREVSNPSELLLSTTREGLSGIAIAATMEGARPLLVEVQALVSTAAYGTPQRTSTGFDGRRLNMLLAVLEKRVGFKLALKDVFLNIAGGLRVSDPAIDLAVLAAVLSSNMDVALDPWTCLCGEVGLGGEIRPVNRLDNRIREAEKLGFSRILIPDGQRHGITDAKIQIIPVARVADAFRILMKQ